MNRTRPTLQAPAASAPDGDQPGMGQPTAAPATTDTALRLYEALLCRQTIPDSTLNSAVSIEIDCNKKRLRTKSGGRGNTSRVYNWMYSHYDQLCALRRRYRGPYNRLLAQALHEAGYRGGGNAVITSVAVRQTWRRVGLDRNATSRYATLSTAVDQRAATGSGAPVPLRAPQSGATEPNSGAPAIAGPRQQPTESPLTSPAATSVDDILAQYSAPPRVRPTTPYG